jgi:hypothetical protein
MFLNAARASTVPAPTEVDLSAPGRALFTPGSPTVATDHETGVLQQMQLLNGTYLDQLSKSISTHIEAYVNTLSRTCIHPGTREGELSDSRGSDW